MTDFQQQIRNAYEHLTNIQADHRRYFLGTSGIRFRLKRLEGVGRSDWGQHHSVIRFTRSIGYQATGDMQQELQQSILGKASLPERLKSSIQAEGDNHLLLRTFQTDVDNIQETLSVLSETVLSEAVSSIVQARNVYIIGIRGNFSVAHYLGYRLGQIKPGVHLVDGISMAYPEQVIGIQPEDICIAFLTPRYSKMTANLVSWIKRKGIKVNFVYQSGKQGDSPVWRYHFTLSDNRCIV